jgi:hypothetical protein
MRRAASQAALFTFGRSRARSLDVAIAIREAARVTFLLVFAGRERFLRGPVVTARATRRRRRMIAFRFGAQRRRRRSGGRRIAALTLTSERRDAEQRDEPQATYPFISNVHV